MHQEFAQAGKSEQFEQLKPFLSGDTAAGYDEVATHLSITPGAVAVAVHRLRHRYRQIVREEIANTVASPAEVEDELRSLVALMSG